jgi:hypothetical protein
MAATQMVLVYDIDRQAIRTQHQFTDAPEATSAFRRLEQQFRGAPSVQVVMLSGASPESIRATHGSYFREPYFFIEELNGSPDPGT